MVAIQLDEQLTMEVLKKMIYKDGSDYYLNVSTPITVDLGNVIVDSGNIIVDSGNITVDGETTDPKSELEISLGNVVGYEVIHSHGVQQDFDQADDGNEIRDVKSPYQYDSANTEMFLVSSDNTDDDTIRVVYLDEDGVQHTVDTALTGQTAVSIGTDVWRVLSVEVNDSTEPAGDVYLTIDDINITAGVPDTLADIRAKIPIGQGNSLMAIYTIPAGYKGVLTNWEGTITDGANKTGYFELRYRPVGKTFRTHNGDLGNSSGVGIYKDYKYGMVFDAKTDIAVTVDNASADNLVITAGFVLVLVAI